MFHLYQNIACSHNIHHHRTSLLIYLQWRWWRFYDFNYVTRNHQKQKAEKLCTKLFVFICFYFISGLSFPLQLVCSSFVTVWVWKRRLWSLSFCYCCYLLLLHYSPLRFYCLTIDFTTDFWLRAKLSSLSNLSSPHHLKRCQKTWQSSNNFCWTNS